MTNCPFQNLIKKILVIDSDQKVYQTLKDDLKENNIIWAKDGKSGLTLAQNELPNFVITEVCGPHLNGFEIVKELKKEAKTSDIKFIMVSDLGLECNDEDFLQSLGIEKFLVKSNYSPLELTKEIEKAI